MPNLLNNILPHHSKDKYYFFSGDHYTRYTSENGTDKNFPRAVSDNWSGLWDLFPGPYDASIIKYNYTKYYFFKGNQYVRYTPGEGVDSGYPKYISEYWTRLWREMPGPYDACFYAKTKDKYYFFKGENYVRMSTGSGGGVDAGYPKKIKDHWHNMPEVFPPPYDAVVQSKANESIYFFFKGNEYVRYNTSLGIDTSEGEYPQSTEYSWPGVWQLKTYSAITLGSFTPLGPLFSIRLLENKAINMVPLDNINLELLYTVENDGFVGYTKTYRVNMAAGANKTITLQIDGENIATLPIKNAPSDSDSEPFSLAMGSCLDDGRNLQLQIGTVEKMVSENPDMMIWNGDTSYYIGKKTNGGWNTLEDNVVERGDMKNPTHSMFLRMFKTRHHPSIVNAMCNIPAISTWDDHDFGFNNSTTQNMSPQQITDATKVFRTCWPNNYKQSQPVNLQSPLDKPINHSVRYGRTEIFFPDSRSHRGPDPDPEDGKILGDVQLSLLITSMTNSDACLKILILSSQLIPTKENGEGFYASARGERTTLLDAFKADDFGGRVLILSGDVHYSELSYDGNTSDNPTIIEVTSSPMLLKAGQDAKTPAELDSDPSKQTRIWSVKGNTYAILNISYTDNDNEPIITIQMRNSDGTTADIYIDDDELVPDPKPANAIWKGDGELESSF